MANIWLISFAKELKNRERSIKSQMIWPNTYLSEVKFFYKKSFEIIFAVRVAVAGQFFFDVWVACEMGFNKAEL